MSIPGFFIGRPITTTLITAGIILFGVVAYQALPVSDLPTVDYPTPAKRPLHGALDTGKLGRVFGVRPRPWREAVAEIVAVPWGFATGSDFGYPETTGPRPSRLGFTKWFARRIAYASQVDAGINRTFVGVQQLLVPPSVLRRPGFVLRVLRQARRRLRTPAPQP